MLYTNLDDHIAHYIDNMDFLLDEKYRLMHPYSEGVKRSYVFRNEKAIKDLLKAIDKNYNYEINVNIDDKIIYVVQDEVALTSDVIERRKEEHDHYKITDYKDFILIFTYFNHGKMVEHLSETKKAKSINMMLVILVILLLLGAGIFYLIKIEGMTLEKLKSMVN